MRVLHDLHRGPQQFFLHVSGQGFLGIAKESLFDIGEIDGNCKPWLNDLQIFFSIGSNAGDASANSRCRISCRTITMRGRIAVHRQKSAE